MEEELAVTDKMFCSDPGINDFDSNYCKSNFYQTKCISNSLNLCKTVKIIEVLNQFFLKKSN